MSTGWNFADVWEAVAAAQPSATALIHGDRTSSWGDFDRRADGIANALTQAGLGRQDKVAQYLYNGPEYLESLFGIFKAGLAPVNTNYRYAADELVYLWDNADACAVIFHGTFAEGIDAIRGRVTRVRLWLWVDDGSSPCPPWATPYEEAARSGPFVPLWKRTGDDLYLLYTGGTTGMPKGVMWRQDDVFRVLNRMVIARAPHGQDLEAVTSSLGAPQTLIPACPLMHGTGMFSSLSVLSGGGRIVTLQKRSFDPAELLAAIETHRVTTLAIVGDAFAKPILRELDAEPGRWDVSTLNLIVSSGVMWSSETKAGLLRHNPALRLADQFSSSEAVGMGNSVTTAQGGTHTATFTPGPSAIVVNDQGRKLEPGTGQVGRVAVSGHMPIGYYKDAEKTSSTFIVIDGVRHSMPGDYAMVEADGSLKLLGRGSVCINTGGEKVFPEEVEEALKTHAAVRDAVVVGLPDDRWGEAIVAVVELNGASDVSDEVLVAHVKSSLAAYKAPKRVLQVDTIGRAPNGKVDYARVRADAAASLKISIDS